MAMDELNTSSLNNFRAQKAESEKQIFLANEQKNKIEEEQEKLNRYYNPDNEKHVSRRQSLAQQWQDADNRITSINKNLADIEAELSAAWEEFIQFTDPKTNLNRLDEHYPILLLPLRIETRFKKVPVDNSEQLKDQLWVRVYPDDCSVDTFEDTLSESEIRDVQNFWMDWWIAAGDEGLRRAAWKYLVDGHGHGRAQYMINNYKPENYEEILHSGEDLSETTVYLVINGKNEILDEEKELLTEFWIAVWRAQGNPDEINDAKAKLIQEIEEERATYLINSFPPKNIKDKPPKSEGENEPEVEVKFIEFDSETASQQDTWSHAPKVIIMPERLYLLGYIGQKLVIEERGNLIPFPLIVGPNPKMDKEDLIEIPGTDIKITEDMRWMVDFDNAVDKGMGFKIDIASGLAEQGIEKLFVLGVKMSSARLEGQAEFETLIKHHYFGNSGFSFLPVGTPTNNTLNSTSAFTESDDADESFDLVFNSEDTEAVSDAEGEEKPWWAKTDRKWFCEMLGITEETFNNTINTDGYDQLEARAMNIALWPTTWGYFFETMLQGALNQGQIEQIRWYFNHFVIGRGTIPSIRIDDQPYGILPTTAFSKIRWLNEKLFVIPNDITNELPVGFARFLPILNSKFTLIQDDWLKMLQNVSYVGKEDDPHQLLLDILGLHGGSVEFHNRIGESFEHIYNLYKIAQDKKSKFGYLISSISKKKSDPDEVTLEQVLKAIGNSIGGRILLQKLGYTGDENPEILEKLFVLNAEKLTGPLIDDQPLSEFNSIRAYSNGEDGNTPENYLQWLLRVAGTSFDKLRKEEGFIDNKSPNALLYLMLKHAFEQSYFETTLNLYQINELLDSAMLRIAKTEPDFIHIRTIPEEGPTPVNNVPGFMAAKPLDYPFHSESRYNLMYQQQAIITNDPNLTVADYIPEAIQSKHIATKYLSDQLQALKLLEKSPTARLERAFIEHIDCASYRFDAWKFGTINYQLKALRNRPEQTAEGETQPAEDINKGLYIGAYGWLENVKSEEKELIPKKLTGRLKDIFKPSDDSQPIYVDKSNLGFINAPSLNHAVTAAILRNGYLAHADEKNAEVFNINLSSERVRKALKIIEGIQNGQNLAALLGYEFERGIHDNNTLNNVDHFVFKIRRKFPLVSNQMLSTLEESDDVTIQQLEANNVVNGLDLIQFVEKRLGPNEEPLYFDELDLGTILQEEKDIIEAEINNIRDINDAVADLAFSESVHQVTQNNIDRAAGTLDTYSSGNYPQIPDVVQTPRSGVNLTHRIGIHIPPNAQPVDGTTPRALAEPGLNSLLQKILPDLNLIRCYVSFFHVASNTDIIEHPVSLADLGVQPIDLLYLIDTNTEQAMNSLDDLIVNYIMQSDFPATAGPDQPPRPDTDIKITYHKSVEGFISIFEIVPLIYHLKAILLRSRPLQASDIIVSNEAEDSINVNQNLDKVRIDKVLEYLNLETYATLNNSTPVTFLNNFVTGLEASLGEGGDDDTTIISNIDATIDAYIHLLKILAPVGLPQTGTGFIYQWRKTQMNSLFKKVEDLITVWDDKEAEYGVLEGEYLLLTDPDERIAKLLEMERVISTETTLEPGNPDDFMTHVISGKISAFRDKRDVEFNDFINTNYTALSAALSASASVLTYDSFYLVPTDIDDIHKACLSFADELLNKAKQLQKDLNKRIDKVNDLMTEYGTEAEPAKQVRILQDAAKILLSEEFKMIPSFAIPSENAGEWKNAIDHVNDLLDYQKNTLNHPLPVDDWFYGIARVREKMGHMEQAILLCEGFKVQDIELTPVQFPHLEPYCWFATEFGHSDEDIGKQLQVVFQENDHLLYTAYYPQPFDENSEQCGLLIDEWTETVPTKEETTGVAFHYDRPNSEPPQTMLLALSPQLFGEGWSWHDLIDILHETLQEAKLRAVEPRQINNISFGKLAHTNIEITGYANLLPATISTVTKYPISIMLNYAFNNQPLTENIDTDGNE